MNWRERIRKFKLKWHDFWSNYHKRKQIDHEVKYIRLIKWDDVKEVQ